MIKLEFLNFDEMLNFAKRLIGESGQKGPEKVAGAPVPVVAQQQVPVQSPVPQVPVQAATQAPAAPSAAVPPVTPPVPGTPAVLTTAQSYTLDDIARAAMTLMDSGRQGDLRGLLASFGVDALPALPQTQFGAFATALRGMGAQI